MWRGLNQITAATIEPKTGTVLLGGTVTCSTSTEVTVYGVVRQGHGLSDHFAEYAWATQVVCGPTPPPYAVEVTPTYQSDRLVPGPVSAKTWAEYCSLSGCFGRSATDRPRVRPTREGGLLGPLPLFWYRRTPA